MCAKPVRNLPGMKETNEVVLYVILPDEFPRFGEILKGDPGLPLHYAEWAVRHQTARRAAGEAKFITHLGESRPDRQASVRV